jgi:hypothetical protein
MAVISRTYTSHEEASRAVGTLLGAGVPGAGIRVLAAAESHDVRTEPEGEFAGTTAPDDVVGDFAGPGHRRDEGEGTFEGSAAEQRVGSFADTDSETVASYPEGTEHVRVTGPDNARTVLVDAGLTEADADRDCAMVRDGGIVVVADLGDQDPAAVQAALAR